MTMNSLTKWMVAAAALTVAAVGASAQVLQADVPFSFGGVAGRQNPGSYQVTIDSNYMVHFRNLETHEQRLAIPMSLSDPQKDWRSTAMPRLVFQCAAGGCDIVGLWTGGDAPALNFHRPKASPDARIAMIPLRVITR